MALEQKAFVFDYDLFAQMLSDILRKALATNDLAQLERFIDGNLNSLRDPNEGTPLKSNWRESLETTDAHQLGDLAVTMFYDPTSDIGLGYQWEGIQDVLEQELDSRVDILLGQQFGPTGNVFDPGKMGSYFQPVTIVQHNLASLEALASRQPGISSRLAPAMHLFRTALSNAKGLYVTF